jgi:hypothetical protein
VLLTTFSDTLANALTTKLRRLISNEPRLGERLEVQAMNGIGQRLYELNVGKHHQDSYRVCVVTGALSSSGAIYFLVLERGGKVGGSRRAAHGN